MSLPFAPVLSLPLSPLVEKKYQFGPMARLSWGRKGSFKAPHPHPPPRAAFKGFVSPLQGNLGGLGSPFPAFPAALSPLFLFWGHFQVYGAK